MEELLEIVEKVKFIIAPFVVVGLSFLAYKFRKEGKITRPCDFHHEGYYKITRDFEGNYKDSVSSFSPLENNQYFYLRSSPFYIEVTAEVTAANGKNYRALAVTSVYLPREKADVVIERFKMPLMVHGICDKEIDNALSEVLTGVLEGVVTDYNGEESAESLKKIFAAKALTVTMLYGHLIEKVAAFSIVEIKERTE